MEKSDLYEKLMLAYSDKNLNEIAGALLNLYKAKDYSQIRTVANRISKYITIEEENDARCFSKLIMIYHPDRGQYYRDTISSLHQKGEITRMEEYSHIFLLDKNIPIASATVDEAVDYHADYEWEHQSEGYSYFDDRQEQEDFESEPDFDGSFYHAVKLRMYGNLNTEFPTWYLEDLDEIELAGSGIEYLEGIEYCLHAVTIDLSDNHITDVSELWNLARVEELYLANNHIGYIDALSNLLHLKILDISGNEINDISPLFELENLEYVNMAGNNIPVDQIVQLKNREVLVIH